MKEILMKWRAALLVLLIFAFVSCDSNKHLVNVIVEGLTGTMILQNNSADNLTVSEDGTYVFSTMIEKDNTYEVTILTAPTSLTCTVTDASGTIGDNNAIVGVDCRGKKWFHPVDLFDFISPVCEGSVDDPPKVAMDSDGNAVVVWTQNDGHPNDDFLRVYKSEYRDGVWTHPADCSDFMSPGDWGDLVTGTDATTDKPVISRPAKVAMGDNGDAVVAWIQDDHNDDNTLLVSEYRNGAWTHPTDISTDNFSPAGEDVKTFHVCMDNSGNTIVTWRQYDGVADDMIYLREYRDGAWSAVPDLLTGHISPEGDDATGNPECAMDDNGNAIIAWLQDNDDNDDMVFISEYRGGAWTHPVNRSDFISFDNGDNCSSNRVAMSNSGDAMVAYFCDDYDGNNSPYVSHYRGGMWYHPRDEWSALNYPSVDGDDAYSIQLSMNDFGNALVTWNQYDLYDYDSIFKAEYVNGSWIKPASLDDNLTPADTYGYYAKNAVDNNGNKIVAWEGSDYAGYYHTYLAEYRNGSWTVPSSPFDYITPFAGQKDGT